MLPADTTTTAGFAIRPHHLLCLFCRQGGGQPPECEAAQMDQVLASVAADRNLLITLDAAFDCMGGPQTCPQRHDAVTRRKDLQVLRALNLVPGDTRSARELLLHRLPKLVPGLDGICSLGEEATAAWPQCPVADTGAYQRGISAGVVELRSAADKQASKSASCADIATATRLQIRPHHLLCLLCGWGGGLEAPLVEDNLWEVMVRCRQDPDVEIELVEGCCMVCPPCTGYDPDHGICDAGCGLRDRLKDLSTLFKLGLRPGAVVTARQAFDLIYQRISDIRDICENPGNRIPEWRDCGGCVDGRFAAALARGKFYD
jgi:hypothetical protein